MAASVPSQHSPSLFQILEGQRKRRRRTSALPLNSQDSSQDGEESEAGDSRSPLFEEQVFQEQDLTNVPDIDNTDSHAEPLCESQGTPTPWPQRFQLGKIPDCRATLPGRKSALEKAMRNFADKKSGFVVKPEISQEFDSLAEAYDFYNLYSWETSFGIKYGQSRRNVQKCKTVQDKVCGCAYDMPFGLFVGVNNHFQSIILGGVLLRDETTKTFEWVFREFAALRGGKAPKTIVTDQAHAMELATASQWPNSTHRWCKWHVLQKARENLGPVYSKNNEDFQEKKTRVGGAVLNLGVPLEYHASKVMINLGVKEIPRVHILNRWMKNACKNLPEHLMIYKAGNYAPKDATYRHSHLYSKALEIVKMGDKNTEAYGAAMKHLLDAIDVLKDTNQESDGLGLQDQTAAELSGSAMPITPGRTGLASSMNVISRKRD
ncbi:hypothetical protein D1007_55394 [Hordeum vulgare]|nr:hypothetical protein D1007_55394 [Hordeum vulgare]